MIEPKNGNWAKALLNLYENNEITLSQFDKSLRRIKAACLVAPILPEPPFKKTPPQPGKLSFSFICNDLGIGVIA